jgi:hypothetical protein
MKKLLFLFCFLTTSIYTFAQDFDWVKQSTSVNNFTSHSIFSIEESDQDFYIAGDFWTDISFDNVNFSIQSDVADGFILKINSIGDALSFWHFESSGYVRINKILKNSISGSLIATGYYNNDLTFENNYWESEYFSNGFIMSIEEDGSIEWISNFEGQNEVSSGSGDGLAVDKEGNIYVGIEAFGNVEIDDQLFEFEPETSGIIIAKFSSQGVLLTTNDWKGISFEGIIDITELIIDDSNDLVIVGAASGDIEIQEVNYSFSPTTTQPFIIKIDTDLNLQWLKTYSSNRCHILDILIDGNDMVLSMQYNDFLQIENETLTGSGSWGDMAIISLDVNANLNWAKNFTLTENGGTIGVYGNSINEWNNTYYIGGMYQGDVIHEGEVILDNVEGISYQYPFLLTLSKSGEVESIIDFIGSNGIGAISDINSTETTLIFGGAFSQHLLVNETVLSAPNSALFYAGLSNEINNINQTDINEYISIHPTISENSINIISKLAFNKLEIISSNGTLLKEISSTETLIDIRDLQSGMYYLSIETELGTITKAFIKL